MAGRLLLIGPTVTPVHIYATIESFRNRFKTGLDLPDLLTGGAGGAVKRAVPPTTIGPAGEVRRDPL